MIVLAYRQTTRWLPDKCGPGRRPATAPGRPGERTYTSGRHFDSQTLLHRALLHQALLH